MHSTVSAHRQYVHICHAQDSNYIAATHNITYYPRTSTCTTPTPLPSTTLLCINLANTKHVYLCKWQQNGTRCRDGVKVSWYHSHLVWLVFESSIPTSACFHSETFFTTLVLPYTVQQHCYNYNVAV